MSEVRVSCPSCSEEIPANERFCPACGSFVWTVPSPTPEDPEQPARPAAGGQAHGSAGLRLVLEPDVVDVTPGEVAATTLTVVNTGTRVEEFTVTVAGLSWLRVEPRQLSVYPGQSATVAVEARPPRSPRSPVPAGPVGFQLVVTSALHPDVTAAVGGRVDVAAFAMFHAELTPPATRGRGTTAHRLSVTNGGNRPLRLDVGVRCEPGLDVRAPHHLELAPGERLDRDVGVTCERIWVGRPGTRTFTLEADPRDGTPPTRLTATRTVLPWLPPWAPLAAVALATAAIVVPAQFRDEAAAGSTTSAAPAAARVVPPSDSPTTPPARMTAVPTTTAAETITPSPTASENVSPTRTTLPPIRTTPPPAPKPSHTRTRPAATLTRVSGYAGMTVGMPQGWRFVPDPDREEQEATDPENARRFMLFGRQPFTGGSLRDEIAEDAPDQTDYRELRLEEVRFGDSEQAVDWEFRLLDDDRHQHVLCRFWVVDDVEYYVAVVSDEADWNDTEPIADLILDSPTPK